MKLPGRAATWVQCQHGRRTVDPSIQSAHRGDGTHTSPTHIQTCQPPPLPHLPIAFFSVSYVISSAGAL